ncbi:hypothetical protein B0H13DRAFT_1899542 [Mycena leptocephala]|nr:hypothetical protein B0H13DRAFT_1899542 [Mycena leptocephala]
MSQLIANDRNVSSSLSLPTTTIPPPCLRVVFLGPSGLGLLKAGSLRGICAVISAAIAPNGGVNAKSAPVCLFTAMISAFLFLLGDEAKVTHSGSYSETNRYFKTAGDVTRCAAQVPVWVGCPAPAGSCEGPGFSGVLTLGTVVDKSRLAAALPRGDVEGGEGSGAVNEEEDLAWREQQRLASPASPPARELPVLDEVGEGEDDDAAPVEQDMEEEELYEEFTILSLSLDAAELDEYTERQSYYNLLALVPINAYNRPRGPVLFWLFYGHGGRRERAVSRRDAPDGLMGASDGGRRDAVGDASDAQGTGVADTEIHGAESPTPESIRAQSALGSLRAGTDLTPSPNTGRLSGICNQQRLASGLTQLLHRLE